AIVWGSTLLLIRLAGGRWGARGVDAYVQLFRNTPVLLPIYLIYFAFPMIGLPWPAVVCGGLALILQNGAYVSEILRGSVNAIDRVQFDAARSLGLAPWSTFRKIVLPQVLVYSIPALGNQVVLLLKDTSLLSAISITELTMQAKLLTEQTGAAYEAFIVVALLYMALLVFYALPALDLRTGPYIAGTLVLIIYTGALFAEVFRGGVLAIPRPQWESARSLGLPPLAMFRKIVAPLVTRYTLPPYINVCVMTVKASSVLSIISVWELTLAAREIIERTFAVFTILGVAAAFYFVMCFGIDRLGRRLERRLTLKGFAEART